MTTPADDLTPRRLQILRRVIEEHIASGVPVGSRRLAASGDFPYAPSTLRYELAWLERAGLLNHPHTSAGRVPTELGYRLYAAQLVSERGPTTPLPIDLAAASQGLDATLRATTEALAHVTSLLVLVSAPPLSSTVIRHVEVLLLQPQVVMVVIITSSGGVAKRLFMFGAPVDAGLADWARSYLNETVAGTAVGTHALNRRFDDPQLSATERAFLGTIKPLFTDLVDSDLDRLYIGGASRLISELGARDVREIGRLAELLEERGAMLALVRDALGSGRVLVRIGAEHVDPAFWPLSMVAASYGLGGRTLGAVSLVGPTRMDYALAISTVRGAATALSEFVEIAYG